MFFVKGWVPLSEVAHTVRARRRFERIEDRVASLTPGVAPKERPLDDEEHEIWQICEDAERVGVLLSNGAVVDASKRLISWHGASGASNPHVNLYIGTIGSSEYNDDVEKPVTFEELKVRYGDFLGLPILLPESCMTRAWNGWDPLMEEQPDEEYGEKARTHTWQSQSPTSVAERIVAAYDSGERLTKFEFREIFAPDLSVRGFALGWRLAVEQRPELSRPGRRPQGS